MNFFNKIFRNINQSYNINIHENGLKINGRLFLFPISIQELNSIFGKATIFEKTYNTIYTWDKIGVYGYSKNNINIETFAVELIKNKDYRFLPRSLYNHSLKINGVEYLETKLKKKKPNDNFIRKRIGVCDLFISLTENGKISSIEILEFKPEQKNNIDKYKFPKINGEKITFYDFIFKLAVIQELMYNQEVLKPKFDLYEFVEWYQEREIDIEKEGYEFIPEVVQYFKDLPIESKYANLITEIYQEGGDEVYSQLIPFWTGEEDDFNIQSAKDAIHFPNLKKVILFYENESKVKNEFIDMKIEANYL